MFIIGDQAQAQLLHVPRRASALHHLLLLVLLQAAWE